MFGKRRAEKRSYRKGLKVPEYSAEPMSAYVERESPQVFRGVQLPVKVGRFDDIHSLNDLEDEVARKTGGNRFVARVFTEADKRVYYGTHRFAIAAEPLVDGLTVTPPEPRKSPDVLRIERETELVKLLTKLDEARAEAARARRARLAATEGDQSERRERRKCPGPV